MNLERLRSLRIPDLGGLIVRYTPHVAPYSSDIEIFTNPLNPRYMWLHDKLQCQEPDALKWSFVTNVSAKHLSLSTQRNYLRRKWNRAFLSALKERGFTKNGKRPATEPGAPEEPGLRGTLEILVHQGSGFKEDTDLLYQRASAIVEALEKLNTKN